MIQYPGSVPFIFQIEDIFPVPLRRENSWLCFELKCLLDGLVNFQVFSGEFLCDLSAPGLVSQ